MTDSNFGVGSSPRGFSFISWLLARCWRIFLFLYLCFRIGMHTWDGDSRWVMGAWIRKKGKRLVYYVNHILLGPLDDGGIGNLRRAASCFSSEWVGNKQYFVYDYAMKMSVVFVLWMSVLNMLVDEMIFCLQVINFRAWSHLRPTRPNQNSRESAHIILESDLFLLLLFGGSWKAREDTEKEITSSQSHRHKFGFGSRITKRLYLVHWWRSYMHIIELLKEIRKGW